MAIQWPSLAAQYGHGQRRLELEGKTGNGGIRVRLDDMELWKSFHQLTNEMIVTKNGR